MKSGMKIGLIARADARGLGHITREFFRHMKPAKTLVVKPVASHHHQHDDWYPFDADHKVSKLDWKELFPEENMLKWLDGLDVVYSAETFYDERVPEWARSVGCASVLHTNPEFYRADVIAHMNPTAIWNQSPWRHHTLRDNAIVVPTPVATDRFQPVHRGPGPLKVLHVVGGNASEDRNGTLALLRSLSHVREPVDVTLVSQTRLRMAIPRLSSNVTVRTVEFPGDYWNIYNGYDVLVMPRRYAGNSLPVQEAMAAGLAVVMTDCSPNEWWEPVIRVPAGKVGSHRTPCGLVDLYDVCPWSLAETIDRLAVESPELAERKRAGVRFVAEHLSWDVMKPKYQALLADAANRA